MNFRTRIDFTNRQAKQYEKTDISLSGKTTFGLPYTALTSGPDLTMSAITYEDEFLISTYSGNTGTTVYTWGDPRMTTDEGSLSALTPSNSGTTQYAGPTWTGYDMFTTVDGYTGYTSYSAVTYSVVPVTMVDLGGGDYSGTVQSDFIVYSATSLDWTGSTIWVDVSGITRTNALTVSDGAIAGYVLTAVDSTGRLTYSPMSGGTGSTNYWTAATGTQSFKSIWNTGNTITSNDSMIGTGRDNTISGSASEFNVILASDTSIINGATGFVYRNVILGGSGHLMTNRISDAAIIGGVDCTINDTICAIVGSSGSTLDGRNGFIGGGRGSDIFGTRSAHIGGYKLYSAGNDQTLLGGVDNSLNGASAHRSGILGGSGNTINGTSTDSAIIGGSGNTITSAPYAVILGGFGISATTGNTVYVPDLVIDGLISVTDLQTNADGLIIDGASDITLKTNIKSLESPLNKIIKLNPVSFEWIPEMRLREGTNYGLIAQEVKEVIPEIVRNRAKSDGKLTVEYKEIIPWLIGAVKELATKQPIISNESTIKTDEYGRWIATPAFASKHLILPEFTPDNTNDDRGMLGDVTWDDDYIYIKTNNGWGRSQLQKF